MLSSAHATPAKKQTSAIVNFAVFLSATTSTSYAVRGYCKLHLTFNSLAILDIALALFTFLCFDSIRIAKWLQSLLFIILCAICTSMFVCYSLFLWAICTSMFVCLYDPVSAYCTINPSVLVMGGYNFKIHLTMFNISLSFSFSRCIYCYETCMLALLALHSSPALCSAPAVTIFHHPHHIQLCG